MSDAEPRRFPAATSALCAVNVGSWLLMVARGVSPVAPTTTQLLHWGALYGPSVHYDHQWWRLVSSAFVHLAYWHVGLNMLALALIGPPLERALGSARFAALYGACIVAGQLVSLDVSPNRVAVGASGAIFGLFGAALALRWLRPELVATWSQRAQRSITGTLVWLAIFSFVPGVDNAAHVGGALTGFVLVAALERGLARVAVGGLGVLAIVAALLVGPRVTHVPEVHAWHLANEARKLLAAGKPKDALALLDQDPPGQESADTLHVKLGAYVALGDRAHIEQVATQVIAVKPEDPQALASLCEVHYLELDFAGAARDCAHAERVAPSPQLHQATLVAQTYDAFNRGDLEATRTLATSAIELQPKEPSLYVMRASAVLSIGRPNESEADWKRILELDPGSEVARAGLCANASQAERADADAVCARVVAEAPKSYVVCSAMSEREGLQADYERALIELARCEPLATPAAKPGLLNNRAWYELYAKRLAPALEHANAAVALAPDKGNSYGTRCFIEAELGKTDAARKDCQRATALEPRDLFDRGMVRMLDGDPRAAFDIWNEELAARPWRARQLVPYIADARRQMARR